ncbi:MAG: hypothetical protein EBU93_05660 [Chlamydiae bacterium]|jgi:hypothetical protein|nr:hypothetical protein [Chlamydiota bacterium]
MKWSLSALMAIQLFLAPLGYAEEKPLQVLNNLNETTFKQWKKLQSNAGKCRIAMPEQPEHLQQKMFLPEEKTELRYDVYVAGVNQKQVYMMLIAEYPPLIDPSYAELSLESFLNGILTQNPNNRLIFADLVQVHGHKALDFFIKTKDVYFKGRAIMANNQLYLLAMECEMQHYHEPSFNFFINSFEFLK